MRIKITTDRTDHHRFGVLIPREKLFTHEEEIRVFFKNARPTNVLMDELKKDKWIKVQYLYSESDKAKPEIKQEIKEQVKEEKKIEQAHINKEVDKILTEVKPKKRGRN